MGPPDARYTLLVRSDRRGGRLAVWQDGGRIVASLQRPGREFGAPQVIGATRDEHPSSDPCCRRPAERPSRGRTADGCSSGSAARAADGLRSEVLGDRALVVWDEGTEARPASRAALVGRGPGRIRAYLLALARSRRCSQEVIRGACTFALVVFECTRGHLGDEDFAQDVRVVRVRAH
jgi:hypothetical protein